MKKIFFTMFLGLAILISTPALLLAGTVGQLRTATGEEGLYKFQSVDFAVSTGDNAMGKTYKPGDVIDFEGSVHNKNSYPVVHGYIFARVGEVHGAYMSEGYKIVDEFYVAEDIAIDADSQLPVNFSWTVPAGLNNGQYSVDYFFSVDNRFNLGGLPFTNEINAGASDFFIDTDVKKVFELDKTLTTINGAQYYHIGAWPSFSTGSFVAINQPIVNYSDNAISLDVTYDLYSWDSLRKEDFVNTKKETITVPAKSTINLVYNIEKIELPVSYIKVTAEKDGVTSIVNIRLGSDITETRINYSAINKFPLLKGDSFSSFISYHTTSGVNKDAVLSVTLKDQENNILYSNTQTTDIGTQVEASAAELVAESDYTYLKLEAELKDSEGKIVDSYQAVYDCDTLNSEACYAMRASGYDYKILLYSLFAVLFLLIIIFLLIKSKKSDNNKPLVALTGFLLFFSLFPLISSIVAKTGLVSASEIYIPSTSQSNTSSVYRTSGWEDRRFADIMVSRRLDAWINVDSNNASTDISSLKIGDVFYVRARSVCTFLTAGGNWDTPYCDNVLNFTDSASDNEGRLFMTTPAHTPAINFDSSKISCVLVNSALADTEWDVSLGSGTNYTTVWKCTATGAGVSTVSTTFTAGNSNMYACAVSGGDIRVTATNPNNNNPDCDGGNISTRIGFGSTNNYNINDYSISLPGTDFTWTVNIQTPIHGGWSAWSPASCPTACGLPASTQIRTCTNPPPSNGGNSCVGSTTQTCPATAACSLPASSSSSASSPGSSPGTSIIDPNCTTSTCNPYIPQLTYDSNLNCTFNSPPTSPIQVNTRTEWNISSTTNRIDWKVNGTVVTGENNNILERYFSTVGLKTVQALVSNSTHYGECTATTTVVLQGGGIGEQ